ncbi:hypothetical protein Tco_0654038 [Tanacetum coccineum]|uniref:Uncharacterized protein n=1 Tax=Tanacetum coccineum TaxID=301880 RepID=A0ABQ4X225_9ASTR
MLFQGQWSFVRTVPLVGLFLRCRCAKTELIMLDLIFPLTYQLLQNSGGYSRPNLSFNKSASPERLFSSARVSFSEASLSQIYPSVVPGETIPHHVPQSSIFQASLSVLDLNHWNSGFFFIDRRAIPDTIGWRHPNVAIDDLRPTAGSFNMANVRRLSAHVIKLRDMPKGVLVLSRLSRVWKSRVCDLVLQGADGNVMGIHDFLCLPEWTGAEVQEESHLDVRPTLQRLPFYCTPPATAEAVIPDPTLEDLAASTSGAASSHVSNRTRSALAQSSGSTTQPSLFMGDDDESDDDDVCVEISLVTPLCSTALIPSSGNKGGSSIAPTAEGSISLFKLDVSPSFAPGVFCTCSPCPKNFFTTDPSASFLWMYKISYVRVSAAHFANRPSLPESFSISSIGPSVITATLCFLKVVLRDLVL